MKKYIYYIIATMTSIAGVVAVMLSYRINVNPAELFLITLLMIIINSSIWVLAQTLTYYSVHALFSDAGNIIFDDDGVHIETKNYKIYVEYEILDIIREEEPNYRPQT